MTNNDSLNALTASLADASDATVRAMLSTVPTQRQAAAGTPLAQDTAAATDAVVAEAARRGLRL